MPSSRDLSLSLRDVADAIDNINEFTAGMDFEAFGEDLKSIAAVERKLLIISEALFASAMPRAARQARPCVQQRARRHGNPGIDRNRGAVESVTYRVYSSIVKDKAK